MNTDHQNLLPMMKSEIIHPALSELIVRAFSQLDRPEISMRQRCELLDHEKNAEFMS
jgi:hypothetical protein